MGSFLEALRWLIGILIPFWPVLLIILVVLAIAEATGNMGTVRNWMKQFWEWILDCRESFWTGFLVRTEQLWWWFLPHFFSSVVILGYLAGYLWLWNGYHMWAGIAVAIATVMWGLGYFLRVSDFVGKAKMVLAILLVATVIRTFCIFWMTGYSEQTLFAAVVTLGLILAVRLIENIAIFVSWLIHRKW